MRDHHRDVFGRDAELSVLASFIDEAASGPTALLLEGEAGVGKTTLWLEGLEAATCSSSRHVGASVRATSAARGRSALVPSVGRPAASQSSFPST